MKLHLTLKKFLEDHLVVYQLFIAMEIAINYHLLVRQHFILVLYQEMQYRQMRQGNMPSIAFSAPTLVQILLG